MSAPRTGVAGRILVFGIIGVFGLGLALMSLPSQAQAATLYWVGSAGGNFNDLNNWATASGGSTHPAAAPGSSDLATFDSSNTNDCTLSANVNVAGINIVSGYTGTITQNTGVTVTVGSSNYAQAAGTFSGGNSNITINGTYTLSGGIFTSTTATFKVASAGTGATFATFTQSGGTFNHNNGTADIGGANSGCTTTTYAIDVNTSLTFNNLKLSITNSCGAYTISIAANDTLTVLGDLTHNMPTGAWSTGGAGSLIDLKGNLIATAGSTSINTSRVQFSGTTDQTISGNGLSFPELIINKSSGDVLAASGTTTYRIAGLTLTQGSFTAPTGTLFIDNNKGSYTFFSQATGTTFAPNNGTVEFNGGYSPCTNDTATIDVDTSLTFNNVVVGGNSGSYCGGDGIAVASGDTVIATGTVTLKAVRLLGPGKLEARGPITLNSTFDNIGGGFLVIGGSVDQTLSSTLTNWPNIEINKTGGTLTLSGTLNIRNNWKYTAGTVDAGTSTVVFGGPGSGGGSGSAALTITGSHTLNNVTFNMDQNLWGATIANSTTLTVNGTLTMTGFNVTQGTIPAAGSIQALGNVNYTPTSSGAYNTSSIRVTIAGTGNQTLTGSSATAVNSTRIEINKPSGTLTLVGTIATWRDWTYTAGTVDPGTSTVIFGGPQNGPGNITITGTQPFNNLTLNIMFNIGVITISNNSTLTVNGLLSLGGGGINQTTIPAAGSISALGNVTLLPGGVGTAAGAQMSTGTARLVIAGTGNQTLTGQNSMYGTSIDVVINKPSGTLTLASTIATNRNWTYTAGTIDPGTSTVKFIATGGAATITGSHTLNNVIFYGLGGTVTYTIASGTTLTTTGLLKFSGSISTGDNTGAADCLLINTGTLAAQGNVTMANICNTTNYLATATLLINGTGNQTLTGNGNLGATPSFPHIQINKPSGILTLAGTITHWKNWTYTAGTVDPGTSTVKFVASLGNNAVQSVSSGSMSFNHVILNLGAGDILGVTGTMNVNGNLTVTNIEQINTGTIDVSGNVTLTAANAQSGASGFIELVGGGNQTLTPPASALSIYNNSNTPCNVKVNKTGGVATLAGNWAMVSGQNLTITAGTLDLNNFTLNVPGTLTNNGTILAKGAGTPITAGTLTTSLATSVITYTGNNADAATTVKGGTYGTLTFDNPGTTFTLGGAVTSLDGLTITAGTILDASTSNYGLTVAGNWNNAGTFVPRNGLVTLSGSNQSILGTTTFYKLSKIVSTSDQLNFPAGLTTTIQNDLTLQGFATNNPLYIRSSLLGTAAQLVLQNGGTQSLRCLDVKDSNASGGLQLLNYGGTDSGNNTNWAFLPLSDAPVTGIIGWWKFDETSGNAVDSSGNGTTGTLTNGPSRTTAGKVGGALSFDGVNDYVTMGAPSVLSPTSISVSAWINTPTPTANTMMIVNKDHSANGWQYTLRFNGTTGKIMFRVAGVNNATISGNTVLAPNTWYHVVGTFVSPNTLNLYLNGVPDAATVVITDGVTMVDSSSRPLYIGARATDGLYFNGLIDDVRIYNRAISVGEAAALAGANTGTLTLKNPTTLSTTLTNSLNVQTLFATLESNTSTYVLSNTAGSFGAASAIGSTPAFTPAGTWTLSSGDGEKIVYARITKSDNSSYDISGKITLDTTAPAAPTGLTLTANSDNTGITATVTAPSSGDVASLIWRYTAVDGNAAPTYPASSSSGTAFGTGTTSSVTPLSSQSITASSLTPLQTYAISVWAVDTAGNVSAIPAQAYLYLAPPTPRLVVTASGSAAIAGNALSVTITAKDANGTTITNYAGPYSLTWTPTGGTAVSLVSSSTSGISSGVVATSITIGGSNAGPGMLTATDSSSNALTSGTLAYTFYPASFLVTPSVTTLRAGEALSLTVSAVDSAGSIVTRYSGTAALSLNYVAPASGTKGLSASSLTSWSSGIGTVSLTYPDAGQITITAKDTTYVSGITIQGTSSTLSVAPASLNMVVKAPPPRLTKFYVGQPIEIVVKPLAADGTVTPNYRGTVTVSSTGVSIGTGSHAFVPADQGSFTFLDLRATSPGTAKVSATDGTTTSSAVDVGIRAAALVVNPASGPPGELMTGAYVKDLGTGGVVTEDDTTTFLLTLGSPTAGTPAASPATNTMMRMSGGVAPLSVYKSDEGDVRAGATLVGGLIMPIEQGLLHWSKSATSSSTTSFPILQFEVAPTSSTTFVAPTTSTSTTSYTSPTSPYSTTSYTSPTSSTTLTSGYLVSPTSSFANVPAPSSSFTPSTSFSGSTNFLTPSITNLPTNTGSVTTGGTRYDAGVSLGYTLVAPNFTNPTAAMPAMSPLGSAGSFAPTSFMPSGVMGKPTSGVSSAPVMPAAFNFTAPANSPSGMFAPSAFSFTPPATTSGAPMGAMPMMGGKFGPTTNAGPGSFMSTMMGPMNSPSGSGTAGMFAMPTGSVPVLGPAAGNAPAMGLGANNSGSSNAPQFNVMSSAQAGQPLMMPMNGSPLAGDGAASPDAGNALPMAPTNSLGLTNGFNGPAPMDAMNPMSSSSGDSGPMMIFNPGQGGWQHEGAAHNPTAEGGPPENNDEKKQPDEAADKGTQGPSSNATGNAAETNAPAESK